MFHQRLLAFLKEEYEFSPKAEFRFSDQCAQQFKSQFTIFDLHTALEGLIVHWIFYEVVIILFAFSLLLFNQVGEGKNLSDLLGALFKLAYLRAVATSDPTAASAQSISEIIALTRPKLASSSDKFNFIELIEVLPFKRPDEKEDKGIVIKDLQKQHHVTRSGEGALLSRRISCTACLLADGGVCLACQELETVTIKVVPRKISKKKLEESNPEVEFEGPPEEVGGASDVSDEEDAEEAQVGSEGEDEDELVPGALVWARLLRHHPGVVLAPSEVPANLRPLLSKAKSRSLFVRRFDEEDIKLVLVSRIQLLGTSKQDRERAEKTDEIQRAYNHAVAILRGDV